jgi:3-oxoacyl-[acyl-carrier-protein] synthase II
VTGVGIVSPLGCGTEKVCTRLMQGLSGIKRINAADYKLSPLCPVDIAALVPTGKHSWNDECDGDIHFGKSKQQSKFIEFALLAADIALKDANILEAVGPILDPNMVGVAIGNGGIGSLSDINEANGNLTQSYKKLSPYFVPKVLVNMAAGQVSIKHGFKGPVHSVATACAAGAHSIGDAYNFIRLGYADAMLAGGTDASVDALSLAGFARMKALGSLGSLGAAAATSAAAETAEGAPEGEEEEKEEVEGHSAVAVASRPFHPARNGFVMGEGAGLLVLEELSVAQRRGARILAEVCGYGLSGDAYTTTSPCEDGDGAVRSMRMALRDAGVAPEQVGYVNAHATSTPAGDAAEVAAIRTVFGQQQQQQQHQQQQEPQDRKGPLYVSSTKGATGHLLGAAGAVETIFTVWALHSGWVPPTAHLDTVDPALQGGDVFTHVPHRAVQYSTGRIMPAAAAAGTAGTAEDAGGRSDAGGGAKSGAVPQQGDATGTGQEQRQGQGQGQGQGRGEELRYAVKNSFGFGGTNASLVIGKYIP